jgi:hypothetical protein
VRHRAGCEVAAAGCWLVHGVCRKAMKARYIGLTPIFYKFDAYGNEVSVW